MTNLQIPDKLADQLRAEAKALGITVPDLLARMLRNQKHHSARPQKRAWPLRPAITRRLNAVYARESSALDPALLKLQRLSLEREPW